jgi:uncharacterized cofD-like protein
MWTGDRPVKVVAIGGGHGLAATLGAMRRYADDICAIVSVADDGGSSGRLRKDMGIPAPGDLRRCLVALADPASPWVKAFEHRFTAGELEGHAFGNIIIAGLADATGDFDTALAEAGRLLGSVGRVVPATREPVVLKAEAEGGAVEGQVNVQNAGRISGVSVVPADATPPPAAIRAIAEAHQIVLGPGSLFTSVLAVVAVREIRDALAATGATKVYVANLREQVPETKGYDVAAHVSALAAHSLTVDVVVCDPGGLPIGDVGVHTVEAAVADDGGTVHDPTRLAGVLRGLVGASD